MMFRQQIKYGSSASLLTRSENPGALMEYKIRVVNKGSNGYFTQPVRIYSGMLCPPPQNFRITEEDPEFVTLSWSPPADNGYAPFILSYELKYAIVTNSSVSLSTQDIINGNTTQTVAVSTSGTVTATGGSSYHYYVNDLTPNWLKLSNMELVFDIPKSTFTNDPYYLSTSTIVYTLRAVTHVGNGRETTVAGVLYAS